jgi:hypothetical protein
MIPIRSGESITAVLAATKTTTEPTTRVRFKTGSSQYMDEKLGSTNGQTAVTLIQELSSLGPNEQVLVDGIYINNVDTVAATVTLNKISGGTTYALGAITLQPGDTLSYDGTGFNVTDNNGQKKTNAAVVGVATVGTQLFFNRGGSKAPVTNLTVASLGTTQNSTPTAAQLLNGIVTQTGATGGGTVTLPTGTQLSAACGQTPAIGDTFTCLFASITGGQTLTITALPARPSKAPRRSPRAKTPSLFSRIPARTPGTCTASSRHRPHDFATNQRPPTLLNVGPQSLFRKGKSRCQIEPSLPKSARPMRSPSFASRWAPTISRRPRSPSSSARRSWRNCRAGEGRVADCRKLLVCRRPGQRPDGDP